MLKEVVTDYFIIILRNLHVETKEKHGTIGVASL